MLKVKRGVDSGQARAPPGRACARHLARRGAPGPELVPGLVPGSGTAHAVCLCAFFCRVQVYSSFDCDVTYTMCDCGYVRVDLDRSPSAVRTLAGRHVAHGHADAAGRGAALSVTLNRE